MYKRQALRIEFQKKFGYNVDDPILETPDPDNAYYGFITRHPGFNGISWNARDMISRPYGCQGCIRMCRHNFGDGVGNALMCAASLFYSCLLYTSVRREMPLIVAHVRETRGSLFGSAKQDAEGKDAR